MYKDETGFENMAVRRLVLVVLTFLIGVFSALTARAEIASGTNGTCSWVIDDDGVLTISPTDGVGGTLAESTNNGPWYSYKNQITKVEVKPGVKANQGCYRLFYEFENCTEMQLSNLDVSDVTNAYNMFRDCKSLTTLNTDGWNTGKMRRMSNMFYGCSSLASIDVGGWDTKSAVMMDNMFYQCRALASLDVSGWNTENVTTMRSMFYKCLPLTAINAGRWNTGNVTDMYGMFENCKNATHIDVSGWNTENVTNMKMLFYNCSALESPDTGRWNTKNVTTMEDMFNGCGSLTAVDVSGWNMEKVTTVRNMFYKCGSLTALDVSKWKTDSLTGDMANVFYGCSSLKSVDISKWNTENITRMYNIFGGCSSLESVHIKGINTGNVTDMASMFDNCSSLKSLDLSGLDTGKVTDMSSMFKKCGLTSLDLSGLDTHSLTNAKSMFRDCENLTSLNLSGFNTDALQYGQEMFYGLTLESLDLSSFSNTNTVNMSDMFRRCSNLKSLDISGLDTSAAKNMQCMFMTCPSLSEVNLGPGFRFTGSQLGAGYSRAILPTPPDETTTGKWIKEDGTAGPLTPAELRDQYDANAGSWSGKWIWEEKSVGYTVNYNPPAEDTALYGGSMVDGKPVAAEAYRLDKNGYYRFNYHFDHWDGDDGNTYTDEQEIPANTFGVGDTLTLTAVFEKDDNTLDFVDGEATIVLHADEKAVIDDLPGGMQYQVWEETPSGWQLVSQENTAGTIPPNGTADAVFVNEYVPGTCTLTLVAQKKLDGHVPEDGQFAFELVNEDGETVQTVRNNSSGTVQFEQLVFKQPGTFTYTIREVREDDPAINYDTHTAVVTVNVEDDGYGNLTATSSTEGSTTFENETKPGILTVSKQTDGAGTGEEVFTFEVTLTNQYGQSLDNVSIVGGR